MAAMIWTNSDVINGTDDIGSRYFTYAVSSSWFLNRNDQVVSFDNSLPKRMHHESVKKNERKTHWKSCSTCQFSSLTLTHDRHEQPILSANDFWKFPLCSAYRLRCPAYCTAANGNKRDLKREKEENKSNLFIIRNRIKMLSSNLRFFILECFRWTVCFNRNNILWWRNICIWFAVPLLIVRNKLVSGNSKTRKKDIKSRTH